MAEEKKGVETKPRHEEFSKNQKEGREPFMNQGTNKFNSKEKK